MVVHPQLTTFASRPDSPFTCYYIMLEIKHQETISGSLFVEFISAYSSVGIHRDLLATVWFERVDLGRYAQIILSC